MCTMNLLVQNIATCVLIESDQILQSATDLAWPFVDTMDFLVINVFSFLPFDEILLYTIHWITYLNKFYYLDQSL